MIVDGVDLSVSIGSVELESPVMAASGTAGYGDEFAPFFDLSTIGAIVTKSIAAFEWAGNPAPRVHPTPQGMINAVGLQGPGIDAWLTDHLPALLDTGATVVCSIWGRTVDDYRQAAERLADAPEGVVAVEVNLSCPNLEGRGSIFAHDADLSADVVAATAGCGRPRWAKLSPNTATMRPRISHTPIWRRDMPSDLFASFSSSAMRIGNVPQAAALRTPGRRGAREPRGRLVGRTRHAQSPQSRRRAL